MTTAASYHRMIEDISKIRDNWEEPPIPNDIIDAYNAGKNATDKALAEGFERNLQRACSKAEDLYSLISEFKVNCKHVRLRAETYSCFTALYFINLEDYVNEDKMNAVREAAWQNTQETKTDFFHIDFMFTYSGEDIELYSLQADGFIYYYPSKSTPE